MAYEDLYPNIDPKIAEELMKRNQQFPSMQTVPLQTFQNPGLQQGDNRSLSMSPSFMEQFVNMYYKGEGTPGVAPWAGQTENVDEKGRLLQQKNYRGQDTSGIEGQNGNINSANDFMNNLPFLSGTGTDIGTELFMAGNALGSDKGTPGRGLGIVAGIGSAILGGARAGLSGYALAKANETQAEWQRKQLAKGRQGSYSPVPQYGNTNNLGGQSYQDGGEINYNKVDPAPRPITQDYQKTPEYEKASPYQKNLLDYRYGNRMGWDLDKKTWTPLQLGASDAIFSSQKAYDDYINTVEPGTTNFPTVTTTLPDGTVIKVPKQVTGTQVFSNSQPVKYQYGGEQMPQEQQGGQGEMMQQVAGMAQQMLSQGATPEAVMQALISQGVPQELAQQVITMIMQQGQSSPQMQYGGLFQDTNSDPMVNFNKNVGDVVEFESQGKNYKGKIKKIENGKFFI